MKKSNILLTCLIAFTFLAMIGSGLSVKSEFDKIDRNDPYSGFQKTALADFKYVKLTGNYYGMTSVSNGPKSEIKVWDIKNDDKSPVVTWTIISDTLVVNYRKDGEKAISDRNSFNQTPNVYIVVPKLSGVYSDGILTAIQGVKADSLSIVQRGFGVILRDNQLRQLTASVHAGANLIMESKNQMSQTTIHATDSCSVQIDKDVFNSFSLKTDNSVQVKLPGSLLHKMSIL
jgi:hypothetical protein